MTQKAKPKKEHNLFDTLSDTWWDPNGSMAPLHHINPVRVAFVSDNCDSNLQGASLLDVACGGGLFSESAAAMGANVIGIDTSEKLIQTAKAHAKGQRNITYEAKDFLTFAAKKKKATYDIITCFEVLEHVAEPETWFEKLHKMLQPGGKLFVSTINRNPKAFLSAIVAAEYLLGILPKGTHQYAQCIKPSELNQWAENAGFVLNNITGIDYNPFSKVAQAHPSVSVNYMACFQKK
jgi:2-polyprenyl-6-hydroxyphenyl methylase / 3-demethylubiquinone-9 3-methyltransferase